MKKAVKCSVFKGLHYELTYVAKVTVLHLRTRSWFKHYSLEWICNKLGLNFN